MQKKTSFLLIDLFWFAILGGFIAMKEYTLRVGHEILLKTRPVDPRDLFRGDYVILNYEMSAIDIGTIPTDGTSFEPGDIVYVGLQFADEHAVAAGLYSTPSPEGLFIKGVVTKASEAQLHIDYGIESYFVPEGKGKELERQIGRGVDVRVALDRFGHAVIKALLVEGKEVVFGSY